MKRRRKKKGLSSASIIYMTTILSLSMMGVGYGYWSDNLNLGVSVTTGNLKASFSGDNKNIEGLEVLFLDDGSTLCIGGKIPRDHDGKILIKIRNDGSIPIDLQGDIIEVGHIGTYELSIPVNNIAEELASIESLVENLIMMEYDESAETTEQLQEINELINSMNTIKQYKFEETLEIKQGL